MKQEEIEKFVKEWIEGHEPDTFVRNKYGKIIYSAGYSSLNLTCFFENLLRDYIESNNESESLKDRLFKLANDFAVDKQGDIAVRLHIIHNNLK